MNIKIEDLVQDFYNVEDRTFLHSPETIMTYDMAKQCALIAVDYFMNSNQDIKNEIEDL
jgi:hypothetical protein